MNSSSGSGGRAGRLAELVELASRARGGCGRARRGTRPSPSGRPPDSRRRPAGCRGRGSRAGCTRRCAPTGRPQAGSAGKARHVVLADDVGLELADDLLEPRVHVARAVGQRAPGRLEELAQLLDRRLAERRRRVADEVLPELPGRLLDLGRRPEPHEPLLEAARLERAGERLLDDEHDAVAARRAERRRCRRSCWWGRTPPRGRTPPWPRSPPRRRLRATPGSDPGVARSMTSATPWRRPSGRRCSAPTRPTSRSR